MAHSRVSLNILLVIFVYILGELRSFRFVRKDPGHEVKLVESLTDITKSVDEVQISEVESNETLVENEGTCSETGEEAKEKPEVNSEDILPSAFEVISQKKLLKESRKFNIDLAPKVNYSFYICACFKSLFLASFCQR